MSDKIPQLMKKFQELNELGLWPKTISPPDPQALERIYKIDLDLFKRKTHLSVPDDVSIDQLREDYIKKSKIIRANKRENTSKNKSRRKKMWKNLKEISFQHLGTGVSALLDQREENTEQILDQKLPSIPTAKELEDLLEMDKDKIRYIIYHRRTNQFSNYVNFDIPKLQGGVREISAPKPYLKELQYIIKEKILDNIPLPEHVTGFREGMSILDNAKRHLGATVIINVDIKNFFHSINFYRIRKFFHTLGYSGEISTALALICTKQKEKSVVIKDKKIFVFSNQRSLPMGAPTSPTLANHITLPMDKQIMLRMEKIGFRYSRYADDITVSSVEEKPKVQAALSILNRSLPMHGFKLNESKTRVRGKHEQQEITGLIINSGTPKIPRMWRKKIRSMVHHYYEHGEGELTQILASLSYLATTHPKIANSYLNKIQSKI